MKFVDEARIIIRSGSGGAGRVGFRREKFVPFGGPDGGDGGKGGDVVFRSKSGLNTLLDFRYIRCYAAGDGKSGAGGCRTGANGEDCVIDVPFGTLVKDAESGETFADINSEKTIFIALRGGRGGKGNHFFRSATNQVPRKAQSGDPGGTRDILLELKLLADVGLIGMPNAGKSTLISRVSSARPKIADYPFTTLVPNLGVVRGLLRHSFVIADIPGLIEGAHEGRGLGIRFLKHVERTKVLVHLLDPIGRRVEDIIRDYKIVDRELKRYPGELSGKARIVVVNKMDTRPGKDVEVALMKFFDSIGMPLFFISAVSGANIPRLLEAVERVLI